MRTPLILALMAALAAPGFAVAVEPPAPSAADWRTPDPQNLLVIDTSKGRVIVEMTPQVAPQHVERIKTLARAGFYDGRSFFRVIDDFMAQTGDPRDDGTGGSDMPDLQPEFAWKRTPASPFVKVAGDGGAEAGFVGPLPVLSQNIMMAAMRVDGAVPAFALFCPGVAGMARGGDVASANSQFFLMRQFNDSLAQKYTAWGRVIYGLDVVRAIKTGEPVAAPQDKMLKVRVAADMPAGQQLRVKVIDPASPWFKAEVARVRGADGLDLCAVSLPVQVQ